MFQLNNLAQLVKERKRIGRGGSRGGTSGKGNKGQKARTGGQGKIRTPFEGGQMPLIRRLPKRGFNNKNFQVKFSVVNLDILEKSFDNGQEVTGEELCKKGVLKASEIGRIKVLAKGSLSKKLIVRVHAASESAIRIIEQCGGKVELIKEI